jgi:serine/threonine-protein phosphatase 2A regulatory subunit B''
MGEFMHVDEETDINKVTEYFSYEHFYVLYCRFFELDSNKDSKLSPEDLLKYSEHALSEAIVERVFQLGARAFSDGVDGGFTNAAAVQGEDSAAAAAVVVAGSDGASNAHVPGMTYPDFIYFMLSEEDKTSENSLRYWFSCCDLDSDGVITIDEMRFFYRVQLVRLMNLGQESVSFQDVLCQMLDMLCPEDPLNLTIKDFLRPNKIQLSGTIFDVLFNLHKFLRFEGRDPFQEKAKREDPFNNDWDRFAYSEYHRLAAEEEAYDGGGDDSGITMDIDDNILMSDSNGAYSMRAYDDDDGEGSDMNYAGAKGGRQGGSGTDWYLDDDDDEDDSKQSGAKKTGGGRK